MSDLDVEDLAFLKGPDGQTYLTELAAIEITPENHLQIATKLRAQIGAKRTGAILETLILRRRATKKFSRAKEMYFTRSALEQASAEIISSYRASRFVQAGFRKVADLACGIGGDSITLAAQAQVTGVDLDPIRLAIAEENLRVYQRGENFLPMEGDLLSMMPIKVEAVFADPGRRDTSGRRLYSLKDYQPPVTCFEPWRKSIPNLAIKIGPGVDYQEIPSDAEIEFISVNGEVREAVLWFGDLQTGAARRATLLPGLNSLTDKAIEESAITDPDAYLYEPDGAIIRAHLVTQLAGMLNATRIDANIAYLTSPQAKHTPFARCYAVDDMMPFQLKRLRRYLRERNVGRITIKKRGSPIDPDALRSWLHARGDGECTIFLTQVKGEPTVLIGRRVDLRMIGEGDSSQEESPDVAS